MVQRVPALWPFHGELSGLSPYLVSGFAMLTRRREAALLHFLLCWRLRPLDRPIVFAQPFLDGRQAFAAAEQAPFPDQHRQLPPHLHQPQRGVGAVPVVVDLVADRRFHVQHSKAQATDLTS
jgi:hypothetical protein